MKKNFSIKNKQAYIIAEIGLNHDGNFNKTCTSGNQNASDLHTRMKKKWDDKLQEKNLIKVDNKDSKPKGDNYDTKKTYVNSGTNTTGRVNFFTGKGKRKKYLGVVVN